LPVKCSCDSNHSIDSPVSLMVVWCSTFSLMGLVGAFYIIVATASVASSWHGSCASARRRS
jgi:hypothetical protein